MVFFAAAVANAATFLVPSDRDMIASADAIAIVTAGESESRWSGHGWIETVNSLHVDEAIKGQLGAGSTISVTELGGVVGNLGYAVAGSPQFKRGERALLFLERDDRGNWTTKTMAVGKFSFERDDRGRALLVRGSGEIAGWDYDGRVHREPQRRAPEFLQYVRDVAGGDVEAAPDYLVDDPRPLGGFVATTNATPPIGSYLLQGPNGIGIRWPSFPSPVVFQSHGSQPGAPSGGLTAAQRGLVVWTNDGGSNIVYQYGGTTPAMKTGFNDGTVDGINIILFNDPSNEIPGSYRGVTGDVLAFGGALYTLSQHSFNGETFYTILEADLVVQDGITGAGLTGNGFDHVLAHELGHTLGFRHSDEPPAGGTSTTAALMNSFVVFNADATGATLQAWDQQAATAVYGAGSTGPPPPNCTSPAITTQPKSSSISSAGFAVLSVVATGTEPKFQWYIGSTGNTGTPLTGATTADIAIPVSSTTSFWVRVSNACGSVDSDTAIVTVSGCPAVTINSITDDITIVEGRSLDLIVNATGGGALTYQWYVGPVGTTSSPAGNAPTLTIGPTVTTSYWVAVTNGCGASARSDTITVTVVPCTEPRIVVQPANTVVVAGTTASLYAGATGSAPVRYEWFEGQLNDTSRPVGDSTATLTTKQIMTQTTYWVRIGNPCGTAQSVAATVTPVPQCVSPSITRQPQSESVPSGANALLTVGANAANPTFRWYRGDLLDFSNPVGANAPALFTPPITAATKFWVRIDTPCGSTNSTVATVIPSTQRRRSASP